MRYIIKSEEQRLIVGEVYVPYRLDTWGDFMRPSEIIKAAHYFMEHSFNSHVNEEHDQVKKGGCVIVESYIAKASDPDEFIPGSWIAAGKVLDDIKWEKVKAGEFNGWSMEGVSQKLHHEEVTTLALKTFKGQTLNSAADDLPDHSHQFILHFDNGKLIATETLPDDTGHQHTILKTTATEAEYGHAHRYSVDWLSKSEDAEWEEITQPANEIINAKPDWLALVKHGAIRAPFKIVKSENTLTGVKLMDRVVQSIRVPKGVDLQEFAKVSGLEFLANPSLEAKLVKTKDGIDEHILIPEDAFLTDSLSVESGPTGLSLVIGTLTKSEENPDAIQVTKAIGMLPADSGVNYEVPGFLGDEMGRELRAMEGIIGSTLMQSAVDKAAAHATITGAINNFKAFVDKALSGEQIQQTEDTKMTKEEVTAIVKELIASDVPEMLKTELGTFRETIKGDMETLLKGTAEESKEEVETPEEPKEDPRIDALEKGQKEILSKFDELFKKAEEVLGQPATGSSAVEDQDAEEEFEKGEEEGKESEREPFLFNHHNPKIRALLKTA